ncbi:hypothetical protein [Cupriavidus gilardii]|uniref:Uncharacterized protein n=1 Tax=Cupriavidus gilardii TaxID=82541 RepID=A0A849B7A3_9BURK|nr:hypothetical protein [Cupriavidus gilardii]KAB0595726.1 hypothetical protein F7Q96_16255 [Cupriavidus gilardii]MCT9014760.1 hypothetical protein [Cupriavidus gilardii]MCT9053172.1 hypothetical protein [Cupriavidus gilardii]NNH09823.1 hypothetical protein [Cupriavidus gilardii]USE76981.1 hypothetical protein NDR89_06885 [Cupriavidus gilardii]
MEVILVSNAQSSSPVVMSLSAPHRAAGGRRGWPRHWSVLESEAVARLGGGRDMAVRAGVKEA